MKKHKLGSGVRRRNRKMFIEQHEGRALLAGVVNVNWISTVICGYDELSTCPTNCFVITGTSPFVPLAVFVTSHVTFGASLGTRHSLKVMCA